MGLFLRDLGPVSVRGLGIAGEWNRSTASAGTIDRIPAQGSTVPMRPSTRLPASFQSNALAARLEAFRKAGQAYVDLTLSNPLVCGFSYPAEAIRAALSPPGVVGYTPDPCGAFPAREAIAAWHGHGVDPERIVLTASTSEAYAWLFKLLADPGDRVLVPAPSYPLFEWLARLEGVESVPVPAFFHEGWHLDHHALGEAATARARAVVVVNPNNPTGQYLGRKEWARLTAWCGERDLALIVDEVFHDYPLERPGDRLPSVLEDPDPPCPVFVLSGLSKVALLPQVKLGWIILHGKAPAFREPLSFLADQYLSVSASAQAAAPALLGLARDLQRQALERLRTNLHALDQALLPHPHLQRLAVEGGWSALLRRPALEADDRCALRLLDEGRVLTQPGHYFDFPGEGYLVLSLLGPEADFVEGLQRALPVLACGP